MEKSQENTTTGWPSSTQRQKTDNSCIVATSVHSSAITLFTWALRMRLKIDSCTHIPSASMKSTTAVRSRGLPKFFAQLMKVFRLHLDQVNSFSQILQYFLLMLISWFFGFTFFLLALVGPDIHKLELCLVTLPVLTEKLLAMNATADSVITNAYNC